MPLSAAASALGNADLAAAPVQHSMPPSAAASASGDANPAATISAAQIGTQCTTKTRNSRPNSSGSPDYFSELKKNASLPTNNASDGFYSFSDFFYRDRDRNREREAMRLGTRREKQRKRQSSVSPPPSVPFPDLDRQIAGTDIDNGAHLH
nr:hypothetical protein CFP56_42403 [Quercus suber]